MRNKKFKCSKILLFLRENNEIIRIKNVKNCSKSLIIQLNSEKIGGKFFFKISFSIIDMNL